MEKLVFLSLTNLLMLSSIAFAQVLTPVINNEIRDTSSIRRRELELERLKREADKLNLPEESNGRKINFTEIKRDFEGIQKLQSSIVKAYVKGEKVNYNEIGKLSLEMNKRALNLNSNLFAASVQIKEAEKIDSKTSKSVKNLIIDLDNNVGNFAKSPMFQNLRIVDPAVSEKARLDLEQIIKLSAELNQVADKITKSGK